MKKGSPEGDSTIFAEDEDGPLGIHRARPKSIGRLDSVWSLRVGSLVQSMREGLCVISHEYRYLYVNEAAARHAKTHRLALIGAKITDIYPDIEKANAQLWSILVRAMEERIAQTVHTEFHFSDGSTGWFQTRFEPIAEGLLTLSIEVTEQHEIELQLRQAQKMEAIGRLAGGLAHDFNNLLTVILAYTNLLKTDRPKEQLEDLEQVEAAAQKAALLTRQLLTISRNQITRPIVVSINRCIRALVPMLGGLLGDRIRIRLKLDAGEDHAMVDPIQLDQVLLNLTTNARDAMAHGGELIIETSNLREDSSESEHIQQQRQGGTRSMVRIRVRDTGQGMPESTARRAFEPFFTTKSERQGTGLGLSTSRAIVREAGGDLLIATTGSEGSTIDVLLPATDLEPAQEDTTPLSLDEMRGTDTILLVELDAAVREACARTLRALGYTVFEAAGELEARELSSHYPGEIHALIIDVNLLNSTGTDLARQVRTNRPAIRTLYLSGTPHHQELLAIDKAHLVAKPFVPHTLARQLFELLKKK